jgi:hypothetical protein
VLLHTVTITGADDATDIDELVDLSAEFPFVEWGVLVSRSQEGSIRFPSRNWIDQFGIAVQKHKLRSAMHVCGRWVSDLLNGELHRDELPSAVDFAQRIQINSWGRSLQSFSDFHWSATDKNSKCFIFQWSAVGEFLANRAIQNGFSAVGLFDGSGGQGKSPDTWPSPHSTGVPMGFAGGLGPTNVLSQLLKIEDAAGTREFATWIDMEGRVRTDDTPAKLDMGRVRSVLEQVAASKFIAQPVLTV